MPDTAVLEADTADVAQPLPFPVLPMEANGDPAVRHAHGLPPDLPYCLDAAMDGGEIGSDDRAFVDLFDPGFEAWFVTHLEDGNAFAPAIKARHAAWRVDASAEDVMALTWAGLFGLAFTMNDAVLGLTHEAAQIAVDAGSADDAITAAVDDVARLPSSRRFHDLADPLMHRAVTLIEAHGVEAFKAQADRVHALYEAQRERRRERTTIVIDGLPRQVETIENGIRTIRLVDGRPSDIKRSELKRLERAERGRMRKVLARSYRFLASIAGEEKAKASLSGDTVTLEGKRFDFRVRVANLDRNTHGALDVSVTDKDNVELARLCVYAPESPALDQLANLALHVISGEEDAIVRVGNIIRSTRAAQTNEAFLEVRKNRMPSGAARPNIPVIDLAQDPRWAMEDRVRGTIRTRFVTHLREAWAPMIHQVGEEVAWLRLDQPMNEDGFLTI